MELKEGMYIRFSDKRKNTYIRKVIDGYKKGWYGCKVDKDANNVPYVSQKNILKTSYNIIDLIEVGDVIEFTNDDDIYKIICIPDKEVGSNDMFYLDKSYEGEPEDIIIYKKDMKKYIKSIVTKEQFENIRYMIGE